MWKKTLKREFDGSYRATRALFAMAKDQDFNWKPSQSNNWMTLGQLMRHTAQACGWCCKGFVDGVWDIPALGYPDEPDGEGFLPAAKMPNIKNYAELIEILDADEAMARKMLKKATEDRLENEKQTAPWGSKGTLGQLLLDCNSHLASHKTQLFTYLKLLGLPVNTMHLWGMQPEA